MTRTKKILYAGDSPAGGPANYLLAVLRSLPVSFVHVPPGRPLKPSVLKEKFDAIIISDYGRDGVSSAAMRLLLGQLHAGSSLLMIGGWGSFAGPFGNWQGTELESFLPVKCRKGDDRLNEPSGLMVSPSARHPVLAGLKFSHAPVICGLNRLSLKKNARLVLSADGLRLTPGRVSLSGKKYPLLAVTENGRGRSAALATDLAPHWCGGLVDWGSRRRTLKVTDKISVEVGDLYVRFVQNLIKWICGLS